MDCCFILTHSPGAGEATPVPQLADLLLPQPLLSRVEVKAYENELEVMRSSQWTST